MNTNQVHQPDLKEAAPRPDLTLHIKSPHRGITETADWIAGFEKELEPALGRLGFTRTETKQLDDANSVGHGIELHYRQFAMCGGPKQ